MTTTAEQKRAAILRFMRQYVKEHGYMPTIDDIAAGTGITATSVRYNLLVLRSQGFVTWRDGKQRTLQLCPKSHL